MFEVRFTANNIFIFINGDIRSSLWRYSSDLKAIHPSDSSHVLIDLQKQQHLHIRQSDLKSNPKKKDNPSFWPGPRPFECVRRSWHSDRHRSMRGSIIQQIFR
ncbi:hypothetical protein QVD17_23054 [Tagetes erecta]|uniref:Uncharacterized protein n=1 Tax=Tagetes erecta TaxID=13708 RepID=A0AAD8KH55_TARER|nr:hypothetical protein QVD17_23054 [Tagetes erecta]